MHQLSKTVLIVQQSEKAGLSTALENNVAEMLAMNKVEYTKYGLQEFTLNMNPLQHFADSLDIPTILVVGIKKVIVFNDIKEIKAFGILYDAGSLNKIWQADYSVGVAFDFFLSDNYFGKRLSKALYECLKKDGFLVQ